MIEADRRLALRPECDDDRGFLFALFRSHALAGLAAAPISDAMRESLARMQFDSQTSTYRQQYPTARFDIIELNGIRVGRVVVEETQDTACIVDIALLPERRGAGLGSAVLRAVLQGLAERVAVVRCSVMWNNAASLRMFRRLGFVQATDDTAYLTLEWRRG